MELHSKSRLRYLAKNIRLGWKWLAIKNTLVYYSAHLMASKKVKSFIEQVPVSFLYFKGASLKKESRTML
jgi:hypothetical protein